jgi:hypothetical protein
MAIISHEDSLGLLLLAGRGHEFPDIPSWVPDFSQTWLSRLSMSGVFSATLDSEAKLLMNLLQNRLATPAAIVDLILEGFDSTPWRTDIPGAEVEDGPLVNLTSHYEETVEAFRDWFWMAQGIKGRVSRYTPGTDHFTAFRETLLCAPLPYLTSETGFAKWLSLIMSTDKLWLDVCSSTLDEELSKLDEFLQPARADPFLCEEFFNNPERQHLTSNDYWKILCAVKTHPDIRNVHHQIWMMSRDCTSFVTKSGYIATAPRSIRAGDVIALIPGVRFPMVLRGEEKLFTVVTSAHVHGMMKGEIWEEWKTKVERIVIE